MSKALGVNPDIGLRELLRVSQSNEFDVVYSSLKQGPGGQQGGTFIKPSAAHAGDTTDFDNPDDLAQGATVRQLRDFQEMAESQMPNDVDGLAVLNHSDNGMMIVPRRAAYYAQIAGNGDIVAGEDAGLSLDAAQQVYANQGKPLANPTAY